MFGQPAVNVRVTFYLTLGAARALGETNGRRYALTPEHVLLQRSPLRQIEHSALGKTHDFKESDPNRSFGPQRCSSLRHLHKLRRSGLR
jgi:hypothetical protein